MKRMIAQHAKGAVKSTRFWFFVSLIVFSGVFFSMYPGIFDSPVIYSKDAAVSVTPETKAKEIKTVSLPPLDKELYDHKMEELANNPPPPQPETKIVKNSQTGVEETVVVQKPAPHYRWPVKAAYPNGGALLPFNRIIAYYGNLYSTKMGVLGQYPEDEMLRRLMAEVKKWEAADPETPVIPALHYIAVVAQGSAGADGKYRARMPSAEIDKVLAMAQKINAIVFLDIQVGFSTVQAEVPLLEKYLQMPNVHLGLDPEFSMKSGIRPGKIVGTLDAADVNFAAEYLAKIVRENNLPPKILVVHRYTRPMLTNSKNIKPLPEVQIVVHMDGWGGQAKKIGTYNNFIEPEPVQFTGFKLFYKNDVLEPGTSIFQPSQLLKLSPRPIYIQYQ
jgi:hypothetical protein